MSHNRKFLVGTFILTAAGLVSRIIGFFFRIFLSQTFGEEQLGLYQLIFPIYALCIALSSIGLENALSRSVASKISLGQKKEALTLFYISLGTSLTLSFFLLLFLQKNAFSFAVYILGDIRCTPLVQTISYALPLSSIHSCICGYYFGLKQTKVPAVSQLIEQVARVASVYAICYWCKTQGYSVYILYAIFGMILGELFSCIYCSSQLAKECQTSKVRVSNIHLLILDLYKLAIPVTANRLLLTILQSIEAVSIPQKLVQYGYTSSEALRNYGVLTGMALPCILFPTSLTNSVSTMLLPTVSEIQTTKEFTKLKSLIRRVYFYCTSLGLLCCFCFFLLGPFVGKILFHSDLAGEYLQILAWICPFLYLNSTLNSITNGLGKANVSFFINALAISIRIVSILFFIPLLGMKSYLYGLLLSHIVTFILYTLYLTYYVKKRVCIS